MQGLDDDEPRRFFGPSRDAGARGDDSAAPPAIGEPLSASDASELMGIVGVPELPKSWKQGLFFAGYRPYGLQQVEGGPCGVIAAVQAFTVKALLERGLGPSGVLEVDEKARGEALADALAEVLFRNVGDNRKAVVLVPSSSGVSPLTLRELRCLQPHTFTSHAQLRHYLLQRPYRDLFMNPSGCGVPVLLYSLVWTRGVQGVRGDADDPKTACMIGAHGYCTQELVNLMVFGRAYSNVFDGTKRLGSAEDGWCVLQGAPRRPAVGFLSLFEAFKCIEVGSRYKGPTMPVWIVCAESHYTVLFAASAEAIDARSCTEPVNLYYFDQLARQNEDVKLSVQPNNLPAHLTTGFEETESMITRCIRTKWKEANVDWNGSEPIL